MNKRSNTTYGSIFKILLIPFNILKWIIQSFKERIKISIRFKISAIYAKILLSLMIISSLAIIGVYIYYQFIYVTERNFDTIDNIIQENNTQNIHSVTEYLKREKIKIIFLNEADNIISLTIESDKQKYNSSTPIVIKEIDSEANIGLYKEITVGNEKYKALVFHSINNITSNALKLFYTILIINGCVLILTIIIGVKSNKLILRPIVEMTDTVKNISANNLNLRINVTGSQDELKELAITFNNMLERIQSSYEMQKQFVSDASHELRTPIAVLQGYANMLDRWGKNDEAVLQESIEAIISESSYMKDLVEKLLFIARHDRGTLKIEKKPFKINHLIEEIYKETKIIDKDHKITYISNVSQIINGDRNLIKQALRIFIDNACKYTPNEGNILIQSFNEEDNLIISIKDSGIGISKEELRKIFNRFYRSDKSRNKVGQGLGLPIARIIILSHNGKINVRSKIGVGTEFRVILPLK